LIGQLSTGALAISAIGLVEAMSIARSIASQTGQRLDSNQEFVGQGLANIACGFFSGYTCSGSFTRSAVNYQAGAKTPLSNVFCGVFVLAVMLAFGWLAAFIPLAALAGVVIVIALGLIDRKEMIRIWIGGRGDRVIMVVTLLATLLLPLQFAVLSGILMSLAYYLLQTSTPQVRTVVPDENFEYMVHRLDLPCCPQLGIVEILGDMYFGAVYHIEGGIMENLECYPDQRYLLLRMFSVEHCDISGIHALESIVRIYRERGGDVYISRYQEPVLEIMNTTGFCEVLGVDHFLGRDHNALGYLFYRVLDPAICIYECPVRVFKECQNLPKRLDLVGQDLHTDIPTYEVAFIEPSQLWAELHTDAPPQLVDVREPREYRQGHIQQALSHPFPKLLAGDLPFQKERRMALVCRGGRRSMRAACLLYERGFDRVVVLRGGMLAWEAANLFEAIEEKEG
jgi:SulP family sulfate permease